MTPAKLLAKALARYLGDTAVLSYEDGVKLRGQFTVVAVPANTPIGQAERRYQNQLVGVGVDVIETISAFREVMYTVNVYRDDGDFTAKDVAEDVRLRLQRTSARQHMLGYGLAYSRISEVRDLTTPVDAAQEPRAQFDVFYNLVQTLDEVVLSIESIDIQASYQGAFSEHDDVIYVRKPQ